VSSIHDCTLEATHTQEGLGKAPKNSVSRVLTANKVLSYFSALHFLLKISPTEKCRTEKVKEICLLSNQGLK
jgi:hypothetical protein